MLLQRLRELPGRTSGRFRHYAMLGLADVTITGLWAVTGLRRPRTPPAVDTSLPLTVVERRLVARDENVVAITLAAENFSALPVWHPGAHLDIRLPSGRIRQYSLCGEPGAATAYRIGVRRIPDGGGGSIEVHDALPVGSTVITNGPRNAFPFIATRSMRFIAGGIGITPILPMLAAADRAGADWSIIYAGRSAASLPFLDELDRFGTRVEVRTDDVHGTPTADDLLGECLSGTTVYACGPAAMLALIRERLAGRNDIGLHYERFAAPPVVDGSPFTATLTSGRRIAVAADETLLAALRSAGVDAPYSCQQGFCGTCRVRVTEGVVQHRDTLLTEPEREAGLMLTCVSRAPAGKNVRLEL